jgi:hypothetical protein
MQPAVKLSALKGNGLLVANWEVAIKIRMIIRIKTY